MKHTFLREKLARSYISYARQNYGFYEAIKAAAIECNCTYTWARYIICKGYMP